MKSSQIAAIFLLTVLSQVAQAKTPLPGDVLGQFEAIVAFCGKFQSEPVALTSQLRKGIFADVSDADLVTARKTPEYKSAYKSVTTELNQVNKKEATKTCGQAR